MNELTQEKIVQYLFEAHAAELRQAQTLLAHIAMTPAGEYREGLEEHLRETRDHAVRIQKHLAKQELTRGLLQVGYGLAQGVVGQVMAASKAPVDMMRGTSGEEKVLKNLKDECAAEAEEIATYTVIEKMAKEVGDTTVARLAASIRADEERMLQRLLAQAPVLTTEMLKWEVELDPQYDVRRIGAVDAAKAVAGSAARTVTKSVDRAVRGVDAVTGRTARTGGRAKNTGAKRVADRTKNTARSTAARKGGAAKSTRTGSTSSRSSAKRTTSRSR